MAHATSTTFKTADMRRALTTLRKFARKEVTSGLTHVCLTRDGEDIVVGAGTLDTRYAQVWLPGEMADGALSVAVDLTELTDALKHLGAPEVHMGIIGSEVVFSAARRKAKVQVRRPAQRPDVVAKETGWSRVAHAKGEEMDLTVQGASVFAGTADLGLDRIVLAGAHVFATDSFVMCDLPMPGAHVDAPQDELWIEAVPLRAAVAKLTADEGVVFENRGDWLRVTRNGMRCWLRSDVGRSVQFDDHFARRKGRSSIITPLGDSWDAFDALGKFKPVIVTMVGGEMTLDPDEGDPALIETVKGKGVGPETTFGMAPMSMADALEGLDVAEEVRIWAPATKTSPAQLAAKWPWGEARALVMPWRRS